MADHAENLKSMLQDLINDRHEQAIVTVHDYVVAKTREITGLGQPAVQVEDDDVDLSALETDDSDDE